MQSPPIREETPPAPPPPSWGKGGGGGWGGWGTLLRTVGVAPGVDHVLFSESSGTAWTTRLASPMGTVFLAASDQTPWRMPCLPLLLHLPHPGVRWFGGQQRVVCFSNLCLSWGLGVPSVLLASRYSGPVLDSFTR